jgi:hypothetical protein
MKADATHAKQSLKMLKYLINLIKGEQNMFMIEDNIPMPANARPSGDYKRVLLAMDVGNSVVCNRGESAAFRSAAHKMDMNVSVRLIEAHGSDRDFDTVRMWRTK